MSFTFTKEKLIQYISEEIRGITCFQCMDGFLQMEAISFNDLVEVGVHCVECEHEDYMKFDLGL